MGRKRINRFKKKNNPLCLATPTHKHINAHTQIQTMDSGVAFLLNGAREIEYSQLSGLIGDKLVLNTCKQKRRKISSLGGRTSVV